MSTKAHTRVCSFELDPRGFVRATIRPGAEMVLEDARDALRATAELAGGVRRPVLVDAREVKSQSRDARAYFASEEAARVCVAVAILIGSPVSRVLGDFFLRHTTQLVPTRLFTQDEAAVDWLLTQLAP